MFGKREIDETKRSLGYADINISAERYLVFSLIFSFVFGAVVFLIFLSEVTLAVAFAIIAFGVSFLFLKRLPSFLGKGKAETIQSDLPVAIRSLAIQLNMKIPFEKTFEEIAVGGYRCSTEFKRVVREIDSGASVPGALSKMAERIDSTLVKKIIVQLVKTYEEGGSGEGLKKIADELIGIQKLKAREFGAKLSFLGLLFIALSCIAPTLSLAYGMIGAIYLGTNLTPNDIWLLFLIVFPAANILLILYVNSKTPKILTEGGESAFSKKELSLIETELKKFGINFGFKNFILLISSISIFLSVVLFSFGFPIGLVFLLSPLFVYFLFLYLIELRAKEIESYLPDALFQVGMLEHGVPMEKIIQNVAKSGYGALSEEFQIASRQISAGGSVGKAVLDLKSRSNSKLLSRVATLLNQCYKMGRDIQLTIRETADDIFELLSIAKEQESLLTMQKYTILFGGCILIPIILAFVINIISGLEYPQIEGLAKITFSQRAALIDASTSAAQAYLMIYVFLASVFVAKQEGKLRKFVVYFLIFASISITLFNLTKSQIKII